MRGSSRCTSISAGLRRRQSGDAGAHPADYGTFREFAELCREVLADFGPLWGREARAFFRAHGDREYGPRRIRLRHLGFVTGHARRQTDFLPDCNRERLFGVARIDDAPLSFVGTVEDMAADWRRLGGMLGLPAAERCRTGTRRSRARAGGGGRATRRTTTARLGGWSRRSMPRTSTSPVTDSTTRGGRSSLPPGRSRARRRPDAASWPAPGTDCGGSKSASRTGSCAARRSGAFSGRSGRLRALAP